MNIAPTFLDRIRVDSPSTADELQLLETAITAGWSRQHKPDGTHGTITASGPITERGRAVAMGETIPIFFNPANFTGNGAMTWGVSAANIFGVFYTLIGTRMIVDFDIEGSTVGGVVNTILSMTLPDGYYATRRSLSLFRLGDNGNFATPGAAFTTAKSNLVQFIRNDFTNFTLSAGGTSLRGQLMCEVGTS